jgi:hypothetical protein
MKTWFKKCLSLHISVEKIDYLANMFGQVGVVMWKNKVGSLPNNLPQCVFQMEMCVYSLNCVFLLILFPFLLLFALFIILLCVVLF